MTLPENSTPFDGYDGTAQRGPKLDEPAPLFTARTTLGTRALEDYRGQWVILFSHPADFTPVCTSEFIAFQNAMSDFEALNCSLIGLSVDSVFSHIAWLESIETKFDVKVTFPVIEDVSMAVSTAYGMIHETSSSTATVRSVFVIDPDGVLKALTHYPLAVGRSVKELLRLLKGLQLSAKEDVAVPAEWQPGDDVLYNPPCLFNDALDNSGKKAWYYRKVANDTGEADESQS
ncbi:peroxiredoxin [Litorimonas sp. WD9-15]|uniref:peroxiredoxin n=1 Tax=Litorimonas sp. WD9-15 TaxID=3418716 RepID=UPI003D0300EC